jgi:hypothetical protein
MATLPTDASICRALRSALTGLIAYLLLGAATVSRAELPQSPATLVPSLLATAAAARLQLAVSPSVYLAGTDQTSRAVVSPLLSADASTAAGAIWNRVFVGALQVRHQQGDEGETLWFNPVFDAGMLVRWHRTRGAWIPTRAHWLLGREIRSDAPGKLAPLPIRGIDDIQLTATFAMVAATTFKEAAAPTWSAPDGANTDGAELHARVVAAQDAVTKMQKTRGYRGSIAAAHQLLALSDPRKTSGNPALPPELDRLGSAARSTLQPVSAYRRGNSGWTLVLQSVFAPGVACFVEFLDARRGSATIRDVTVASYTQSEQRS